jgi:hypothetical protein
MKKFLTVLYLLGFILLADNTQAQFKSVPAVVTDAFKAKYPQAANVKWSAGLQAATANFTMQGDVWTARYDNKGKWENSTRKISEGRLPAPVKDGLAKSKYGGSEWKVKNVTERYLPPNKTEYDLSVEKSGLEKRNLTFNSNGKLLKNAVTL